MRIYAVIAALWVLIVAPVEAQGEAEIFKAASDAGVAIVALIALPILAHYLYKIARAFIDNTRDERKTAREWMAEFATRYGHLKDSVDKATKQDADDAEAHRNALGTLGKSVDASAKSADALALDVRALMKDIDKALTTTRQAIENERERQNNRDQRQDELIDRVNTTLSDISRKFDELQEKIEERENHHEPQNPQPVVSDGVPVPADFGSWSAGAGGDSDGNP